MNVTVEKLFEKLGRLTLENELLREELAKVKAQTAESQLTEQAQAAK